MYLLALQLPVKLPGSFCQRAQLLGVLYKEAVVLNSADVQTETLGLEFPIKMVYFGRGQGWRRRRQYSAIHPVFWGDRRETHLTKKLFPFDFCRIWSLNYIVSILCDKCLQGKTGLSELWAYDAHLIIQN